MVVGRGKNKVLFVAFCGLWDENKNQSTGHTSNTAPLSGWIDEFLDLLTGWTRWRLVYQRLQLPAPKLPLLLMMMTRFMMPSLILRHRCDDASIVIDKV